METWAFGTSPYGLGLTEEKLWRLTPREHRALVQQWENSRMLPLQLHASIQATLHNVAGKTFKDTVSPDMFMPGYQKQPQSLEAKMAIFAGMMRRQVKCPDCGEFVKAREVHSCHGSPIHAQ